MKARTTLLIICLFLCSNTLPQKILKVDLTEASKSNPFSYQSMLLSKADYATAFIDTSKYDVLLKAQVHFQPDQFIWQNYKQGIYSFDTVNYMFKNRGVDTGRLYAGAINESVYVLVLKDKKTRDSVLLFNNFLSTNISKWQAIRFNNVSDNFLDIRNPESTLFHIDGIQIYSQGKVTTRPVYLFPLIDRTAKKLIRQISFVNSYYTTGYFKTKGKRVQLYAGNMQAQHFFDNDNTGIRIEDQNQKPGTVPYKIGDTVNIGGYNYQLYKIAPDAKTIMIKALGVAQKKTVGFNTGYLYQDFKAIDIVDKSQINSAEILKSKKYILLDFWGTWCGPCIKGIPALRAIYEQYNRDIEIISIAGEQNADTANVLSAIGRYNMPWKHLMFYKNVAFNRDFLLDQYRINAYPTYILINSQGLIVQRKTGMYGTESIKDYLVRDLGY